MTPTITKRADQFDRFHRDVYPFIDARSGFASLLRALGLTGKGRVLLPSYIGFSQHEGSGVFDPVHAAGVNFDFYRLSNDLQIDLSDLHRKLEVQTDLVVFIHYFGYPDRALDEAVKLARAKGTLILEDAAHALFSDWVTGLTGRWGDASLFSLHKMLPVADGGLLQVNATIAEIVRAELKLDCNTRPLTYAIHEFDLVSIAAQRRQNTLTLLRLLKPLSGKVDPLFPDLPERVVPQSFPVIINGQSRDHLYFDMNRSGFGTVSLYHTLIPEIDSDRFSVSHSLSKTIFNLPVHQDATEESLVAMVFELTKLCRP